MHFTYLNVKKRLTLSTYYIVFLNQYINTILAYKWNHRKYFQQYMFVSEVTKKTVIIIYKYIIIFIHM